MSDLNAQLADNAEAPVATARRLEMELADEACQSRLDEWERVCDVFLVADVPSRWWRHAVVRFREPGPR